MNRLFYLSGEIPTGKSNSDLIVLLRTFSAMILDLYFAENEVKIEHFSGKNEHDSEASYGDCDSGES